jgi:hypothetical protein
MVQHDKRQEKRNEYIEFMTHIRYIGLKNPWNLTDKKDLAKYFGGIKPENKSSESNQGSLPNCLVLFKPRMG